jgi:hypothetical protein
MEEADPGMALAAVLVACAAIALALIPVAIALFQPALPPAWIGVVAATFGASLGGVKLLAIAWAAGERLLRPHPAPASPAFAD